MKIEKETSVLSKKQKLGYLIATILTGYCIYLFAYFTSWGYTIGILVFLCLAALANDLIKSSYKHEVKYPEIRSKHPEVRRLRLAMTETMEAVAALETRDTDEALTMCETHAAQGTLDKGLTDYVVGKLTC